MYNGGFDPTSMGSNWNPPPQDLANQVMDPDEGDQSRRPPNAFILYSQAMRSSVRQDNPSLSNTEVSRLLGKMWKEVPNETKLIYKQKAQKLQEEFKSQHPDYTYRKARRKRALNELLTKSTQGTPFGMFPGQDISLFGLYPGGQGMMGAMPAGMVSPPFQNFAQAMGMQQQGMPNMGQQPGMQGMNQQGMSPLGQQQQGQQGMSNQQGMSPNSQMSGMQGMQGMQQQGLGQVGQQGMQNLGQNGMQGLPPNMMYGMNSFQQVKNEQ